MYIYYHSVLVTRSPTWSSMGCQLKGSVVGHRLSFLEALERMFWRSHTFLSLWPPLSMFRLSQIASLGSGLHHHISDLPSSTFEDIRDYTGPTLCSRVISLSSGQLISTLSPPFLCSPRFFRLGSKHLRGPLFCVPHVVCEFRTERPGGLIESAGRISREFWAGI